jgi:hypothetical protein
MKSACIALAASAIFAGAGVPEASAQVPASVAAQSSRLSAGDAAEGLRTALNKGIDAASKKLSKPDGYLGDAAVRIPLPGRLAEMQKKLKPFGMSGALDDLQLRINRVAEANAADVARKIGTALKTMTLEDALGVLRGGETSATDYLRKETEAGLRTQLTPQFTAALATSGAMKAYEAAARKYGAGALAPNAKDWLAEQAVTGALNGMFYTIGREEAAIRANPAQRTSDLLRRVFGG